VDAAQAAAAEAARDTDWLAHAMAELDALAPREGEEAELDLRRRQLRAAEKIRADVARAAAALGPEGAEAPLVQALRWLEAAAPQAEGTLDPALDVLGRVLDELAEASRTIEALQADLGDGPGELEAVEERLFAIRALARKHQVQPDALAGLAGDLRSRLRAIDDAAETIERLAAALAEAERAYATAAARLGAARREAAGQLDARMAEELPPLRLGRAVFATEVTAAEPGPQGSERVRFTAAINPGAPPGPIDRIASGGELSRFLLALKVCLSGRTSGVALIFDEIDRGVGGATADAVGRRLEALAETAHILVVTHAPQVAARAAHHWRVGKRVEGDRTRTEVEALGPAERQEEIARMLAGDMVTPEARAAAGALIGG
jgi:DNA repair protein RecN (Recombination protein N)